jgi:tetratricopeptide (TPR) repeat protein
VKVPDLELSRFEAHALAKLGRLSDAVLLYSRLENKPGLPSWLFKCHLASIYDSGRDHDTALKLSNEAITLKPDSILYVDHANRLARYFQDPAGARAALQHVDMDLLVDLSKPYVIRLRGIVAWLEDDFANARRDLEAAIEGMEKTCHIPGRAGNIAVAKGYLCCVCAELGDMETARKCWKEARVYLLATKETKLISDCEAALSLG